MKNYIIDWIITYCIFFAQEWVYKGKPSFITPLLITFVLAIISYILLEPKKSKKEE